MSEMLRKAIVRIRRETDQHVVGVGFLIDATKKTILTCAHVVNASIEDFANQHKPRSLIILDFPFINTEDRFDARVTNFFPKKSGNTDDIAVLEILDDLPADAKAVQLTSTDNYSGHGFGVYGFPVGFEANGQYVEGKLQEVLVNKRIQAVGTSNLGYFVEQGFSGSPVYDKELDTVVGMMMQVDVEPEKRVAFICPPDVIEALYTDVRYKRIKHSAKAIVSSSPLPSNGKWLQRVDIFISSPSDVAEEREAILRVIERLNRLSYIRTRYVLNPLLYEKEVPPEAGDHAQMIVDRYMAVEDSYLLICLMWNRMGTPFTHPKTGEAFQSGTEYEFTVGYRANGKNGKPHLLLYRKTTERSDPDESEKEKVDGFFKRFEGNEATFKGLYKQFTSLSEFENMLFEHIERILHDNPPDTDSPDTRIAPDSRPDIVEEARRLDAAMPRECQVGHSTEVRVMICLPASEGLRALLPDYTAEGDLIDKRDVQEGSLAVAFPIDKATGNAKAIMVSVEAKSRDFIFDESTHQILLSPNQDSGLLVFTATSLHRSKRGRIQVNVQTEIFGGLKIILGSVSVSTTISSNLSTLASKAVWSVMSTSLFATQNKQSNVNSNLEVTLKNVEDTASKSDERTNVTGGLGIWELIGVLGSGFAATLYPIHKVIEELLELPLDAAYIKLVEIVPQMDDQSWSLFQKFLDNETSDKAHKILLFAQLIVYGENEVNRLLSLSYEEIIEYVAKSLQEGSNNKQIALIVGLRIFAARGNMKAKAVLDRVLDR